MKSTSILLILAMVGCANLAHADEPHLSYAPNGEMKLQLTQVLKDFRLCAVGPKFTFCSEWQHPKSRTVDVDLAIPSDTPDGKYSLFYEEKKKRIELHHVFEVEK